MILPRTGERVKRAFTLRNRSSASEDDFRTPLLRRRSTQRTISHLSTRARVKKYAKDKLIETWNFAKSRTGQGIIKCSIAYVLGSLATFVMPISGLLGKSDGKHVVATITVYFHPARSAGSMIDGTICALIAFAYTAFISYASMAVSVFFAHQHLMQLGHAIVLVVFVGGGLGFIGWFKQMLGSPLVNVACSLASLASITILTKEGAIQAATYSHVKITQTLKMVLMGIFASSLVSFVIQPISARKDLRKDLMTATDLLGDLLTTITATFLSGHEDQINYPSFDSVTAKYKKAFSSLVSNLRESKLEHYVLGTENQHHLEARLVRCIERLATDIGGLRSACLIQTALLEKPSFGATTPAVQNGLSRSNSVSAISPLPAEELANRMNGLESIFEEPEDNSDNDTDEMSVFFNSPREGISPMTQHPSAIPTATSAADIFALFINNLGGPLKSLAYTLKEVLAELPFGSSPDYEFSQNATFRSSLIEANQLFKRARREGLNLLYQNRLLNKTKSEEIAADYEEVAASCGYFSSSLQDLAEDTIAYLDVLEELELYLEQSATRKRSWNWMKFWRLLSFKTVSRTASEEQEPLLPPQTAEQGLSKPISLPTDKENDSKHVNPNRSAKSQPYSYRLWRALRFFRREDIRFAAKVGIGAIAYAVWSFMPFSRPFFSHWRGEWGLLSYMLVCSMTIGAANTTGYQRFTGTCIGAVFAIAAWAAAQENAWILGFFGWLISLCCFYIIVGKGKGPMGRFILLTYNLSCLYAYSLSVKDDDNDDDEGGISPEIWEIVLHRVVAVMIGCIWGIIVTRLVWPISARQKLKDGISVLWLRMGLIWKRDPLTILIDPATPTSSEDFTGFKSNSYMDIRESLRLQRFLTQLEALQASASKEFELRGPFPEIIIQRILAATGRMLDAFHAMNVVIVKDLKASPGEALILKYTEQERMQLSARISHLFTVLASSIKLEYPMSDALPDIEHTRDRLLAKVFEFRKIHRGTDVATDEDYELLYAYALVTGQLATDIVSIIREVELLFGTLDEETLKLE
ncbi:hypothetical protein K402DRAFT_333628 [Aulographum hederae CBS 113979]|uniref:Integral membrane bound transporter domain-containing protein n=1 Tax=Aulographum hederae CBS 113979 TaxID=1176131 RepID=A0A6G1GYI0_9PEZI|nr:hypothetical protein K402DRAFT_333628 [Aulographum hederae CBS 113979]